MKITYVRSSLLIPCILLLIYLGAFTEKNTLPDLVLVFAFGLLGWIMEKLEWSRPPLILGLVIGPMSENRLFLSVDNYGATWLARPIVLVLIVLTLVGAFYPAIKAMWLKRSGNGEGSSPKDELAPQETREAWLTFSGKAVFSLGLVILMSSALIYSRRFNPRAGLFPWMIGFPLLGFAILQLVIDLTLKTRAAELQSGESGDEAPPAAVVKRRTAITFAWILGYLLAIWLLGFSIGGPLCAFLQLKFGSREKWFISLILALSAWVFIYGIFDFVLHVPFPDGEIFTWLDLFSE